MSTHGFVIRIMPLTSYVAVLSMRGHPWLQYPHMISMTMHEDTVHVEPSHDLITSRNKHFVSLASDGAPPRVSSAHVQWLMLVMIATDVYLASPHGTTRDE